MTDARPTFRTTVSVTIEVEVEFSVDATDEDDTFIEAFDLISNVEHQVEQVIEAKIDASDFYLPMQAAVSDRLLIAAYLERRQTAIENYEWSRS